MVVNSKSANMPTQTKLLFPDVRHPEENDVAKLALEWPNLYTENTPEVAACLKFGNLRGNFVMEYVYVWSKVCSLNGKVGNSRLGSAYALRRALHKELRKELKAIQNCDSKRNTLLSLQCQTPSMDIETDLAAIAAEKKETLLHFTGSRSTDNAVTKLVKLNDLIYYEG